MTDVMARLHDVCREVGVLPPKEEVKTSEELRGAEAYVAKSIQSLEPLRLTLPLGATLDMVNVAYVRLYQASTSLLVEAQYLKERGE